jgi:DME family drug/metabolite transporter
MHGILVVAAAVLWGTTGTAQALGPNASPLAVGSARLVVAGAVLAILALVVGTGRRRLPGRPVLLGAIGMAAYQPLFFTAVDRTGVAVGTVVALGSAPLVVAGLEWARTRTRPGRRWLVATAPALVGLVLLGSQAGGVRADAGGLLAAVGAGAAYAVFTVGMARLVARGPAIAAAGAVFGLAALMLLPVALTQDLGWVASAPGLATVAWLALGATVLSYLLFTAGLRTTPAPTAATLTLAEPVTATLLAVAVVGERPGVVAWSGIALVVTGLVLAARLPAAPTRLDARTIGQS